MKSKLCTNKKRKQSQALFTGSNVEYIPIYGDAGGFSNTEKTE